MRTSLALLLWGVGVCGYAQSPGTSPTTGDMNVARVGHTGIVHRQGELPVAGGRNQSGALPGNARTNAWTSIGPQGGDIQAISMDPHNPGTLYAATDFAPFKSSDAGGSWVKSNVPNQSLVFDPQDPNTIYAFSQAAGVSKSTDGGKSWNAANSGLPLLGYLPPRVFALVIDPLNSSNLFVGTWQGIFKSTDRGTSWNSANSGIPVLTDNVPALPSSVPCLAIDPRNPSTLYAVENGYATPDGVIVAGGLFKSADGGGSWNLLNLGLPPNSSIDAVAVNPQSPNTLYVGSIYGIFKSTDGGSDWTPVNSGLPAFANGLPGGAAYYSVDSLAIDQQQPDTVYAAITNSIGSRVLKTTNGGASWSDAGSGLPENTTVRSLQIDSQIRTTLYAATGAGVFKSTDGAITWTPDNSGLISTVITDLAITPGNSSTLYAATSSELLKTTDGGKNWSAADSGMAFVGSPLAIDPQNTSTIFAIGCTIANYTCGVVKSADGGASWSVSQVLFENPWVTTLTIDPQNSNVVYATIQEFDECGEETLYKSVDGGMSWSHSLFNDLGVSAGCILALAVDPRNTNNLFAAFQRGGVFKSTDAGATWNVANSGLSADDAEALAIDPGSPGTIYAVSSEGVFKSRDGATSWNPAGSVPDLSGSAGDCCFRPRLAVDPQDPAHVYLGLPTEGVHQVYQSSDGGVSWTDSLAVSGCCGWFGGLAISSQGPTTVYAGSPGEGVFAFRKTARATKPPSR
jgi:photosystem II stability/assembly factor-like uncharacterized protein